MKGLIVSNGTLGDYRLLREIIDDYDIVLCADGGVDHLRRIHKLPDLVMGDLDSISKKGLEFIKDNNIPVEKHPIKKDETDTELAINYLIQKKCKYISIVGGTGTRFDHSLANIFLLKSLLDRGIRGSIIDENNIIFMENNYMELIRPDNKYVSIIPLTDEGVNISLDGFLYPLEKKLISFGSTLGISNEIIDSKGCIYIHYGIALIIISKD